MPYVKPKPISPSIASSSTFTSVPSSRDPPDPSKSLSNMIDDLPTPRPTSQPPIEPDKPTSSTVDDLQKALETTSLYAKKSSSDEGINTSESTTSLASLGNTESASERSEVGTPPTSAGSETPDVAVGVMGDEAEDPVARYKEGLYAYTRTLYLEAKLSQSRKDGIKTNYGQFGLKQSGMEKLAAKKALARRLNA